METYREKAMQGNYVEAVADFVDSHQGTSFVELQALLAPYMQVRGNVSMHLPDHENIILWAAMSKEFFDVITDALSTHRIESRPAQSMVYVMDGGVLNMPLAKSPRQYKEPHWLPVAFHPYCSDSSRTSARKRSRK